MNAFRVFRERTWLPRVSILVVGLAAVACKKEPPPPPPFSVEDTAGKMASLALDDAFFTGLDALKSHAASEPAAAAAYGRFALDALAVLAVTGAPVTRLTGGDLKDGASLARFLNGVSQVDKASAPALAALATAVGGAGDLSPTFAAASSDAPVAPALRLFLARRLLTAIKTAAEAPESERGAALQAAMPGLPTAPARTPAGTAFPNALQTLSGFLAKGAAKEAGLAPHFQKLSAEAEAALSPRSFPIPLASDPAVRAGTPTAGARGAYQPLAVLGVKKDGATLGARPVLAWQGGKPVDLTASVALPGRTIAAGEALEKGGDEVLEAAKTAAGDLAKVLDPVEAKAWAGLAGKGTLAAERKDRPRPVLVSLDGAATTGQVRTALGAATAAGLGELRLLPPGQVGAVLPAFFRKVPAIEGLEAPKGARIVVVLSATAADLYVPAKVAEKLPLGGWPEGATVGKDKDKFFKLSVPWASEKGFGQVLAKSLGALAGKTQTSPLVDVVARGGDLPATLLLDAAAEIAASGEAPFPGLDAWFPGLTCPRGAVCAAAVPVLFSDAAVPKPSKPEITVKEDQRPAGFCEPGAVKRVIMGRAGAIRACYEIELQRHAELQGRLDLRFTIEPDGSVSGVKATTNELNPAVEACVVKQLSGLKFPLPDGGICVIRWPFKFQPGG